MTINVTTADINDLIMKEVYHISPVKWARTWKQDAELNKKIMEYIK